jgi:hypothetical protein
VSLERRRRRRGERERESADKQLIVAEAGI